MESQQEFNGQSPNDYDQIRMVSNNSKMFAIISHLIGFVGLPFLGPLFIYLVKKDDDHFVAHHAWQALMFHIVILISSIVSFLLVFFIIGIILLPIVALIGVIFPIVAAFKASDGILYHYPLL